MLVRGDQLLNDNSSNPLEAEFPEDANSACCSQYEALAHSFLF